MRISKPASSLALLDEEGSHSDSTLGSIVSMSLEKSALPVYHYLYSAWRYRFNKRPTIYHKLVIHL